MGLRAEVTGAAALRRDRAYAGEAGGCVLFRQELIMQSSTMVFAVVTSIAAGCACAQSAALNFTHTVPHGGHGSAMR